MTGYLVPASLVQDAIKNNQNIAVVCYFKADDSTTLKTVTDIIRARKECGEDPTPKDLPYQYFRMEPFVYQPKDKPFSARCEFIPDDFFVEEKEKGFWMSGENPNGKFKASIRRHYADGDNADRRLVITGPGAVQAGKDFFPELFGMDDIYWSPMENIFIDPSGLIHFLDCYNPEVYVKPLAKFLHNLDDRYVFLSWKGEPIGDKPHGFDIGFVFITDANGEPTGKLFSFTASGVGKLHPEVHLHYGEWDEKGVYRNDLNLPQEHTELVAFFDCIKKASFENLTHPVGIILLELLGLLTRSEDRSVLLHKKDSYEVRDCFTLLFEYFDQNTIPAVWADLLKDKITVDKPIISANPDYFRRWTGIDEIPYEVPIIVVPYRLFVFLMNDREQKYFEDTDVTILSDYSEEYPALKKVDLHNSYFLPEGRVLVKVNKRDLNRTRLYHVEQIDTSTNCSMLYRTTPHLTTIGDVENGITYVKETYAPDARSVYAGGIRK